MKKNDYTVQGTIKKFMVFLAVDRSQREHSDQFAAMQPNMQQAVDRGKH